MENGNRKEMIGILIISIVLSCLGMMVQMEWGRVLSPESIQVEVLSNILLTVIGLIICGVFITLSKAIGYKNTMLSIMIVVTVLVVLLCSPLARIGHYLRMLFIGPVVLRISRIIPLAFLLIVSNIITRFVKNENKMVAAVTAITVLTIVVSELFDTDDTLYFLLPIITYYLLFPYMRSHTWYRFLPVVFLVIFVLFVVNPWNKFGVGIELASDRIQLQREMLKSGGLFGNKAALASDKLSYQDGLYLLPIGLVLEFGWVGFTMVMVLFVEMCRRIIIMGKKYMAGGACSQGIICKGVGIYLALSGAWCIISLFFDISMNVMFDVPFFCVWGYLPIWYLYLAAALSAGDQGQSKTY